MGVSGSWVAVKTELETYCEHSIVLAINLELLQGTIRMTNSKERT
jgi:hypothetical protein